MTYTDLILNELNRLNESKKSGVYGLEDLSKILEKCGDMLANKIKLGKASYSDIEGFENYATCFRTDKNKYFKLEHLNLPLATKRILEGNRAAIQERKDRGFGVSTSEVITSRGYVR